VLPFRDIEMNLEKIRHLENEKRKYYNLIKITSLTFSHLLIRREVVNQNITSNVNTLFFELQNNRYSYNLWSTTYT
jgi:hypothetical protein